MFYLLIIHIKNFLKSEYTHANGIDNKFICHVSKDTPKEQIPEIPINLLHMTGALTFLFMSLERECAFKFSKASL